MSRKARVSIKLEIVGLNPRVFDNYMKSTQTLLDSKIKGYAEITPTPGTPESLNTSIQLAPPPIVAAYTKIASIVIDFQRAYGRAEFCIFERSRNKLVDLVAKRRQQPSDPTPEFFVNGVKVFKGVPATFSQLDEAIDRAFGRSNTQN